MERKEPREFLSQFSQKETAFLETLSKYSKADTNLKAMKRLNVRRDMPEYVKLNIHVLPAERRLAFEEMQSTYGKVTANRYIPGLLIGSVRFWSQQGYFLTRLYRKAVTRSLVPDVMIAGTLFGMSWFATILLTNRLYENKMKGFFEEIVSNQFEQPKN